jgi:hypothetical protein
MLPCVYEKFFFLLFVLLFIYLLFYSITCVFVNLQQQAATTTGSSKADDTNKEGTKEKGSGNMEKDSKLLMDEEGHKEPDTNLFKAHNDPCEVLTQAVVPNQLGRTQVAMERQPSNTEETREEEKKLTTTNGVRKRLFHEIEPGRTSGHIASGEGQEGHKLIDGAQNNKVRLGISNLQCRCTVFPSMVFYGKQKESSLCFS